MSSQSPSWRREIGAIFRKEATSELRTKSGLMTAGLFGLVTVVAIATSSHSIKLSGTLAAGLLWVALLFSSSVSLPRTFLMEEELRTGDLLRLWARPEAVFWGKCLFNLVQMWLTGLVLSLLFFGLTHTGVAFPALYVLSLFGGCTALAGAVTLCGALVGQAANRSTLAAAISVPLLLPLVVLGVTAMRVPLGEGAYDSGVRGVIGLWGYAAVTVMTGPAIFSAVWKN